MSEDSRGLLSNRRFAIPLIILLAFCFIGLLMIGIVLIFRPGADEPVAEVTETVVAEATENLEPTDTAEPTEVPATATLRPTNTPVLKSTEVTSGVGADATGTAVAEVTAPGESQQSLADFKPICVRFPFLSQQQEPEQATNLAAMRSSNRPHAHTAGLS